MLLTLEWRACKWPVAEQAGQHLFCGVPLPAGTSEKCFYCAEHAARSRISTKFIKEKDVQGMADSLARGERVKNFGDPEKVIDLVDVMGDE
jgi:hypothetical protein